ncbi:MAG TPA: pentapeptide repeat-containing protein [Thermoanaerobaculia bacterium]|nr:pentapeptide repeat-containing protein [Thermoanaerobaculia bacterium]
MRTSVRISAGLLLAFLVVGSLPAAAQPTGTGSAGRTATGSSSNPEKDKAEIAKLQAEKAKLAEETRELQETNAAIGRWTRGVTTWAGAVGSLFGAFLAILAFVVSRSLNSTQQQKLVQDKAIERQKHLLEIFKSLGEENAPRVRIGAVAILVQRIRTLRRTNPQADPDNADEVPTIVSVLIAASKHELKPEIQKQIADGLAQSLGAIVPDGKLPDPSTQSPLKPYDFQGAKLENAWWRRVDARDADFYGAHLARAGLREAFLSGTALKKATLNESTLEDAQLDGANLQGAKLVNTKMARANLRNAQLARADFSGADLRNAIFVGSNFTEAIFTRANITGADFGGAPPPTT